MGRECFGFGSYFKFGEKKCCLILHSMNKITMIIFIIGLILQMEQNQGGNIEQPENDLPQQPVINNPQPYTELIQELERVSSSNSSFSSRSQISSDPNLDDIESDSHSDKEVKEEVRGDRQDRQREGNRKIRYKYCCKVCKHTDSNKKACVCVVPRGQRRTEIGAHGCQTCGCNGCSKEDFISRGEDPEYLPGEKKPLRKQKQRPQFEARNGCCRNCMKAFSKTNKSCLCQVPENVRNTKLPSTGCKICGCFGCNPEDKKQKEGKASKKAKKERSRSRDKKKKRKRSVSSSNSREYIDSMTMNFNNIDRSVIGGMIVNEYRIDPALLGFGIPQRTSSYLTGKPK